MMNEKIQSLLKLTIPTLLVASLAYELTYFWGMGLSLNSTPLGVNDFLRGWMEWGSLFLTVSLIYFFVEIVLRRSENWQSEEQIINSTSNPERIRKFRESPFIAMKWIAYVTLSMFILFGENYLVGSTIGFFAVEAIIIYWLADKSPIANDRFLIRLLVFTVFFVTYFSIKGFNDGKSVLDGNAKNNTVVEIKDEPKEVVRIFNEWTLFRVSPNELGWIYHQSDRLIKVKIDRERFIGVIPFILKKLQ